MRKGIRKWVAAVSALGLIAGCSETGKIDAGKDGTSAPARNSGHFSHHDRLPKAYENRVRKLLEVAASHPVLSRPGESAMHARNI